MLANFKRGYIGNWNTADFYPQRLRTPEVKIHRPPGEWRIDSKPADGKRAQMTTRTAGSVSLHWLNIAQNRRSHSSPVCLLTDRSQRGCPGRNATQVSEVTRRTNRTPIGGSQKKEKWLTHKDKDTDQKESKQASICSQTAILELPSAARPRTHCATGTHRTGPPGSNTWQWR